MSLAGQIKSIAQKNRDNVFTCTVTRTSPIQLKYTADNKMVLDKAILTIPAHVKKLTRGSKVLVQPSGDGEKYIVLGKG